jgi:hypothetical protein
MDPLIPIVAAGNPGATMLCALIVQRGRGAYLAQLAGLGIVGPAAWCAYMDVARGELDGLCGLLDRDEQYIVRRLRERGFVDVGVPSA